MVGYLRVKSPWSQLAIFLGLFGGAFLLTSLVMAVIILAAGIPAPDLGSIDWEQPKVLSTMKFVQAVSSVLIFLIPAIVFAFITFRKRAMYHLGVRKPAFSRAYPLAIACILFAFPFVIWLGEINHLLPLPGWMTDLEKDATRQMQAFLEAETVTDILINVFIIALLPAIGEEICFRGALQRIVIQLTRNPWVGIVVTAIFFSALHLQFLGFLPRMFLGVVLGAIYWYSGSIWPSVVAHFVNNAVQVVAVSQAPEYIDKNPSIPVFISIASGLVVWMILYMFSSYSPVTYKNVYPEPDEQDDRFSE